MYLKPVIQIYPGTILREAEDPLKPKRGLMLLSALALLFNEGLIGGLGSAAEEMGLAIRGWRGRGDELPLGKFKS